MTVSISQPTLFPWIGYFDMIKRSDVFVFLDNVKFKKQTWHMRNRLKSGSKIEDNEIWIRIPTKLPKTDTLIKDVIIDNSKDWKQDHLDIFQYNYGKKYHDITFLKELYQKDWDNIANFNIEFITACCRYLEIDTPLIRASNMDVRGKKSYLVLDICKELGADNLLANNGSKNYLDKDKSVFNKEGISISYQNYQHIEYQQQGDLFLKKLSILDLLFSEYKNSKQFI
nr:WbqC family protein [uncultured Psychroserpens sp.]